MEALVFLAFPLSLKVHDHLQCLIIYYHRDPPDKRPTDQEEKAPCQSTLAETDCFCKDTLKLVKT